MKTSCVAKLFVGVAAATFATPTSAQAVAYHHHSTAAGDLLGGAAELRAAQGLANFYEANALLMIEQVRTARLERIDGARVARRQRELRQEESRINSIEVRKHRGQSRLAYESGQAAALVEAVGYGHVEWPSALMESRVAPLTLKAESILSSLGRHESGRSDDRRWQLAGIAKRLRDEVVSKRIGESHLDRQKAIRIVRLLELISASDEFPMVASSLQ